MKYILLLASFSLSLAAQGIQQSETSETAAREMMKEASLGPSSINLSALDNRSFEDLKTIAFEKENPYEIRWTALQNISINYPSLAEETLLKAAAQNEWYMKNSALLGLQQMNSRKLPEIAHKLISDEALVVRSMAVSMLAKNPNPETRKLFWSELQKKYNFKKNNSLWIRHQILEHLAENPQKAERQKFLDLVNDKDKKIQTISKNVIIKIQTQAYR